MSEIAVDRVVDRESLAAYVVALSAQSATGADWENTTLERFLESLAAYIRDGSLPEHPTWRTFAELLRAGAHYE